MDMDLSAKLIRENVLNHIEYNTSQCQFTDILFSFREKTINGQALTEYPFIL